MNHPEREGVDYSVVVPANAKHNSHLCCCTVATTLNSAGRGHAHKRPPLVHCCLTWAFFMSSVVRPVAYSMACEAPWLFFCVRVREKRFMITPPSSSPSPDSHSQAESGQVRPSQVRPSQANPSGVKSSQVKPCHATTTAEARGERQKLRAFSGVNSRKAMGKEFTAQHGRSTSCRYVHPR